MHRSRDMAHAQWLQTHCQWYPMGDVRTHNSRKYDLQTWWRGWWGWSHDPPYMTTDQDRKVKGQGHKDHVAYHQNAITTQQMVVSTSNLVEMFITRGETRDTF